MFKCTYNEQLNRLTLQYEGIFNLEDARDLFRYLQALLPRVRKDFQLLVDLSSVESMKEEIQPVVKETMDLLNHYGVREIVRIIPDQEKDIGLQIMSYFHYSKDVKMVTRPSL